MSDQILKINNLIYKSPEVACASRNTKRTQMFAYPNFYPDCVGGEVIPILFNTGGCMIDATKSSIQFRLKINVPVGDDMKYFAFDSNIGVTGAIGDSIYDYPNENTGSTVLNLISQVYHETKDGQLLYRENYKNMMQTIREYKISIEEKGIMSMFGGFDINHARREWPYYQVDDTIYFNIPLRLISPFFNTSKMIPSQILSGSKLSLVVATPRLNIIGLNNGGLNIQRPASLTANFSDIVVNLHQVQLYDGIESVIRSSALNLNKGLQFPFYCYHNSKYTPESTSFTYNVQLAATKVSYVAIKFFRRDRSDEEVDYVLSPIRSPNIYQLNNNQNGNDDNGLGFSIRAKLGNEYFPVYNVTSATEAYIQTTQALNPIAYSDTEDIDPMKVINRSQSGCVPYLNYCDNYIYEPSDFQSGYTKGGTIYAISLEKSNNIGLSGPTTTASKVISVEIEGLTNFADYDMYSQVQYLAVASVFENNCVLSK
jgi:hypothetical protein